MIKTPLSTVIGGAFWTPKATILGGTSKTFDQLIKSLFSNNEQGFFYDPNDLSTMYQDSAGTVPVTGVGQPVGLILDKSGRGNHARQTTSASRPILRKNAVTGANYLEFDGSDDFLVTSNIDFTATDKVSLFAGVRKLSDAVLGMLLESSQSIAANTGVFYITAPHTAGNPTYRLASKGSLEVNVTTNQLYAAPVSSVIGVEINISGDSAIMRVNGSQAAQSSADQGTGNLGNYPLYIGRRGGTTLPFNGHIYSLIGIGRLTTVDETIALEKFIAKNAGVALSV